MTYTSAVRWAVGCISAANLSLVNVGGLRNDPDSENAHDGRDEDLADAEDGHVED